MATITPLKREPADSRPRAPQPGAADAGMLDLRAILAVLRRRKALIASISLLITGLAALVVHQITPLYYAESQLVLETSREKFSNIEAVIQGVPYDYYTLETEAAVIGSRGLAAKVVERAKLADHPLFNPELAPPRKGWVTPVFETIQVWIDHAFPSPQAPPGSLASRTPADAQRQLDEEIVTIYLAGLTVMPSPRARVIRVGYASPDPVLAARLANLAADVYIENSVATKGEATQRANAWLGDRVNELRERLIESERRLETFRRSTGIVEIGQSSVAAQQLAEISSQLSIARTRRAEAAARFDQVDSLVKSGAGVETAAAVLDAPLIHRLREQETEVLRKIAELRTKVRDNHPSMTLIQSELKDLQGKITAEVAKIAANLKNELQIAQVREANLNREVQILERRLNQERETEVTLRAMESEVRANKQLYDALLQRLKETGVQEDTPQKAESRVISPAALPDAPYYPRTRMLVFAAFVVSIVIAMAFAFLVEFFDAGFRSSQQMEAATGFTTLTMIPLLAMSRRRRSRPHRTVIDKPNSAFSEAIRSLRTAIMLSSPDTPPRTVAVLSSVPEEGKTTAALSLTVLAARSGQRAILLDCDLRYPRVHLYLGAEGGVGLSEYLAGAARLDEIIRTDEETGIHYILAGGRAPNPPDLLGSDSMRALLAQLRERYDLVMLDTPPLLAVSDALVLMRIVERAVFVVRWATTRRDTILTGMRQVVDAGGQLAGTVLSMVDMRRHAQYDYRDTPYYARAYKRYYVE
ncbi:MAG: polysaccharide biosynthesis tyrosine autokinase [Alphaproteobacteria bacterium]